MAFSAHPDRRPLVELEHHSAPAKTHIEAKIELLQRMPIFGGIRADVLQFLLALCPVAFVPANEFFFREHDQADSMFVLQAGRVAVLKSWRGQQCLLSILEGGRLLWGDGDNGPRSTQRFSPRTRRLHGDLSFSS